MQEVEFATLSANMTSGRAIPTHVDQVWSLDLGHDQFADGRSLQVFNVIDDLDCKALDIEIDFSLPSGRVICTVLQIIGGRGKPSAIRCDNSPEHLSSASCSGPLLGGQVRIHPAWEAAAGRLCRAVQQDCSLRMALPPSLGWV